MIPKFQTNKQDFSMKPKQKMLSKEFKPKLSFVKSSMQQEKETRHFQQKSRIQKNLDRIKKTSGIGR